MIIFLNKGVILLWPKKEVKAERVVREVERAAVVNKNLTFVI